MKYTNKLTRDGKLVYVYPYKHKRPKAPTVTDQMVAFSYKVGIVQAADLFKVSTYHITKARNELHSRSPS